MAQLSQIAKPLKKKEIRQKCINELWNVAALTKSIWHIASLKESLSAIVVTVLLPQKKLYWESKVRNDCGWYCSILLRVRDKMMEGVDIQKNL